MGVHLLNLLVFLIIIFLIAISKLSMTNELQSVVNFWFSKDLTILIMIEDLNFLSSYVKLILSNLFLNGFSSSDFKFLSHLFNHICLLVLFIFNNLSTSIYFNIRIICDTLVNQTIRMALILFESFLS